MLLASGYFDKQQNPCIKITVSGIYNQSGIEFDAIIDTGYTGFLLIPIVRALPIGLVLNSTTQVTLADGTTNGRYMAEGIVHIVGDDQARLREVGLILLEETGTDVLLGMDFLRRFKLSLGITSATVMLFDEEFLNRQNTQTQGVTETKTEGDEPREATAK